MTQWPAECIHCGTVAESFTEARNHARGKHHISVVITDHFDPVPEDD